MKAKQKDAARANGSPALRKALKDAGRVKDIDEAYDLACIDNDQWERDREGREIINAVTGPRDLTREIIERSDNGETDGGDEAADGGPVALLDEATMPAPVAPEQPENAVTLPLKFIKAALLVAARGDVRYYLNGIFIHAVDGDVRIVSTDGHRLIASRHPLAGDMPAWLETGVIIPRDELVAAIPLLTKNGFVDDHYRGTKHDPVDGTVVIEHDGGNRVILRCANRFASFSIKLVDGKFPDYAKVLAAAAVNLARGDGDAMQASAIATPYLKGAAEIAERLGSKAIHAFIGNTEGVANFFTFAGAPDSAYIVMSVSTDRDAVSDGVVKMIGAEGIKGSLAAFRAHVTRTKLALAKASTEKERAMLEDRRASIEAKIAHLLNVTTPAARQLENHS